jgi:hypothetical protein
MKRSTVITWGVVLLALLGLLLAWRGAASAGVPTDAAPTPVMPDEGLHGVDLPALETLALNAATEPPVYTTGPAGMQTFSPIPSVKAICFWLLVKSTDTASSVGVASPSTPAIVSRTSGMSCMTLSDEAWAEYIERYPPTK